MRFIFTSALVLCAWTSLVRAQAPAARVDSIFAFATSTTPGCAVSVMRNGKIEYAQGYGMADLEHGVRITPATPFYMASVSKQFTAAAINLLVLDGKVSLDDDARTYVPELPSFGRTITIRHLLHHTSGLRDYLTLFSMRGLTDFPITNQDFLETIGRQRALNFLPGDQYSYSNSGYVLLSIIVERVSGKSLRAFSDERIFKPLEMSSTQFRDRHTQLIPNRALAYARDKQGAYTLSVPYFDVIGDGGLFSTASDIAHWEKNFLDPGIAGPRWLALEDVRGRLNDGSPLAYGAGLAFVEYRGDSVVDHGGALGGYNIDLLRFPKRRFSVAVLCNDNSVPSGLLAQRVADVFLGDSLGMRTTPGQSRASTPPLDSQMLARHAGILFNDRTMSVRTIAVRDGKLYYNRTATDRAELVPLGLSRFRLADSDLIIDLSSKDIARIEPATGSATILHRVAPAGQVRLADFAGAFTSAELDVSWTVAVSDSVLTLRRARADPERLEMVFDDAFRGGGMLLRFTRDAARRVTGMDVSVGERVRNVRFERGGR